MIPPISLHEPRLLHLRRRLSEGGAERCPYCRPPAKKLYLRTVILHLKRQHPSLVEEWERTQRYIITRSRNGSHHLIPTCARTVLEELLGGLS
jgi:hypothetical protein